MKNILGFPIKVIYVYFAMFLLLISCKTSYIPYHNRFQINKKNSYDICELDYNYIYNYFTTKASNRPDVLLSYFKNPPNYYVPAPERKSSFLVIKPTTLSYFLGTWMKDDLVALTGIKSKNKYLWSGCNDNYFKPQDTTLFKTEIEKWKNSILKTNIQSNENSAFVDAKNINTNHLQYINYYVNNSIQNRILFIKKYSEKMHIEILILFKTDLDNLLEITTPNLEIQKCRMKRNKINRIIIANSINMWQNKLDMINDKN